MLIAVLFILGLFTGGTAAVVGFGIGSFLTPVLIVKTSFGTAVAAVGIAHFFGSALRFWLLRKAVNRQVLLSFGILSAVGGLVGALLQGWAAGTALAAVFGGLMVFAGISNILGWSSRLAVKSKRGWTVGILSGFFGGLVGNQGGLRAVGLTGFKLHKAEFVATATAVAFAVDIFRLPVYIATRGGELWQLLPEIAAMTISVVIGTFLGAPLLRRLPEKYFKIILSVVLIVVGILVAVGW